MKKNNKQNKLHWSLYYIQYHPSKNLPIAIGSLSKPGDAATMFSRASGSFNIFSTCKRQMYRKYIIKQHVQHESIPEEYQPHSWGVLNGEILTHNTENITFPQLRWRAVILHLERVPIRIKYELTVKLTRFHFTSDIIFSLFRFKIKHENWESYGSFPLLYSDSDLDTDSCTMQILWERDLNLNLSQWKHVLHNTM